MTPAAHTAAAATATPAAAGATPATAAAGATAGAEVPSAEAEAAFAWLDSNPENAGEALQALVAACAQHPEQVFAKSNTYNDMQFLCELAAEQGGHVKTQVFRLIGLVSNTDIYRPYVLASDAPRMALEDLVSPDQGHVHRTHAARVVMSTTPTPKSVDMLAFLAACGGGMQGMQVNMNERYNMWYERAGEDFVDCDAPCTARFNYPLMTWFYKPIARKEERPKNLPKATTAEWNDMVRAIHMPWLAPALSPNYALTQAFGLGSNSQEFQAKMHERWTEHIYIMLFGYPGAVYQYKTNKSTPDPAPFTFGNRTIDAAFYQTTLNEFTDGTNGVRLMCDLLRVFSGSLKTVYDSCSAGETSDEFSLIGVASYARYMMRGIDAAFETAVSNDMNLLWELGRIADHFKDAAMTCYCDQLVVRVAPKNAPRAHTEMFAACADSDMHMFLWCYAYAQYARAIEGDAGAAAYASELDSVPHAREGLSRHSHYEA